MPREKGWISLVSTGAGIDVGVKDLRADLNWEIKRGLQASVWREGSAEGKGSPQGWP